MDLHVYILHATMLSTRKNMCEILKEKLENADKSMVKNLTFTYIESYDVKDINPDIISKSVDLTKNASAFNVLIRDIHIRKLSNALKHYDALKHISTLPEESISLVLEDDIVYSDNVVDRLYSTVLKLEEYTKAGNTWDINFLGLPQPPIQSKDGNTIEINPIEPLFKIIPDISSYLIKSSGAKKLSDIFMPIKFTTNVHMSYLSLEKSKGQIKFMMSTPNVFIDGSKFGVYLSSIKTNNKLIFNQEYTQLYQKIQGLKEGKENVSEEVRADIEKMFETMKFNTHPEIQSLRGQYEMKLENYKKAKEIFDECYQIYMSNDCLLNGESEFLQVYARVHKYLQ